jgi:hypothetical protein
MEFKEAFQELALNYGEAGDIIIDEQDIQLQNPGQYDDLLPNGQRRFPTIVDGHQKFELLKKRFSNCCC